ncbi:hypothetical protein GCM10023188_14800 [Pontibacter saemangeumensis]|uniref:Pentapeptide MXKDX repeat protein n=1 Tax=Pontibacter saemangeumensis TaxID=1084525 RepID=A0ABP8LJ91_9BACT
MKTKMKIVLAALSVAFLMVFSLNVFSQGNKPQQEDKGKKSGCMAMMESKDMEGCMAMMESEEMQAMCAKMMSGMQGGMKMDGDMKMDPNMKMDGNKDKAAEPKSQKL